MKLEDLELSDEDYKRLIDLRGGCRCCISPPCFACCEPVTQQEAELLGLLDEPEPVDLMKAVRDMCK